MTITEEDLNSIKSKRNNILCIMRL